MAETPYSPAPRRVELKPLSDAYSFAFNFADPSGIKLLTRKAASRLEQLLSADGACAHVEKGAPIDDLLVGHGLAKASGDVTAPAMLGGGPRSFNVWLHVVNACNFACHYCYIPQLGKAIRPEAIPGLAISDATSDAILHALVGYCESKGISRLHIKFSGGEPTLRIGQIERLCRTAAALQTSVRITFGMLSNGSFDPEVVLPVVKAHSIRLSVSIDGVGQSHDRVRFTIATDGTREGTWDRVTRNIDACIGAGVKPYFLYTVSRANHQSLLRFADFAHSLRLGFRLSLVRRASKASEAEQQDILRSLLQLYRHLGDHLDPKMPIERFARFAEWDLRRKKTIACSSCNNYVAIDQSGFLSSCQMTLDKSYGSVVEEPLTQILARARGDKNLSAFVSPGDRVGVCTSCEFYHVCAGGCPQHTHAVYSTTEAASPWCRVYGGLIPTYLRAVAKQGLRAVGLA